MKTFIALLRGINVNGKNKLPMAELRELLTARGLTEVQTYIQSGNVVCRAELSAENVSELIHQAIKDEYDYEVPIITLSRQQVEEAIMLSPFSAEAVEEPNKVLITFFDSEPDQDGIQYIMDLKLEGEYFRFEKDHMHFYFSIGAGKAKMTNNLIEKKLKIRATTRNWRTLHKLVEMAR